MARNLTYYDKVLVAIASCLSIGAIIGLATPVELHLGIFAGALVASVFILHAVYSRPPTQRSSTETTAAVVGWHLGLLLYIVIFLL